MGTVIKSTTKDYFILITRASKTPDLHFFLQEVQILIKRVIEIEKLQDGVIKVGCPDWTEE